MVLGTLLDKVRGNPLEKLTTRQLRGEEIRLDNRLQQLRKEIDSVEKQKKEKFRQGIGADLFKKRMLAQEINAHDTEAKLKLGAFNTIHHQLRFVKNLLIVKNYEQDLRQKGLWQRLTSIPRERLEAFLIKLSLDAKEFGDVLNELNKPFDMAVSEMEGELGKDEKEIFDGWKDVEAGSLDVEKAESALSIERDMAKEKGN